MIPLLHEITLRDEIILGWIMAKIPSRNSRYFFDIDQTFINEFVFKIEVVKRVLVLNKLKNSGESDNPKDK